MADENRPDIHYYHLGQSTIEQALPLLIDKAWQQGWTCWVKSDDISLLKRMDKLLWQGEPTDFIPHRMIISEGDEESMVHIERNRIILSPSDGVGSRHQSRIVFLLQGAKLPAKLETYPFERICRLFNGNHEVALKKARADWVEDKKKGYGLCYWQQGSAGWQKIQ